MVVGEFSTETDVVVIGAGPAGRAAAFALARAGRGTTLVDDGAHADAERFDRDAPRRRALRACLRAGSAADVDAVRAAFERAQADDEGGAGSGPIRLIGHACFDGPRQLSLLENPVVPRLRFKRAVIASAGTAPDVTPQRWTVAHALDLATVPPRVSIRGGSDVAIELAQLYAALGATVTLLGGARGCIPGADPELVAAFEGQLAARGIGSAEDAPDAEPVIEAGDTVALASMAIGRTGATTDDVGRPVTVPDDVRTSEPRVFVVGPGASAADGRRAAAAILGRPEPLAAGFHAVVAGAAPALAWCGLSAADAGADAVTFDLDREDAAELGERPGHARLVVDGGTGLILGGGCIGPGADAAIAPLVLALEMGAVVTDLATLALPAGDPARAFGAVARAAEAALDAGEESCRRDPARSPIAGR